VTAYSRPYESERNPSCFEVDGAMVHGDPDMSDESRAALREVITAAKRRMAETQCRCVWRGERCENQATEEDGLCNWCGNGRTERRLRRDPKAVTDPGGKFYGISGAGQLHDSDPSKPAASTPACWYPDSDRTVLDV
jgi:hypothetical protein